MWRPIHRNEYYHICRMEEQILKHRYVMGLYWAFAAFLLINSLIMAGSTAPAVSPYIFGNLSISIFYGLYCCNAYLQKCRLLKNRLYVQNAICVWKKEERYFRSKASTIVWITLVTEDGSKFSDILVPSPLHEWMEYESKLLLVTPDLDYKGSSALHAYPTHSELRAKSG